MESNGDRDRDRGEDAPTNGRRNEEEFERRPPRGRGAGGGEFLCFNCRKSGHMARDCKEKPRNPMYADTRGTRVEGRGDRGRSPPPREYRGSAGSMGARDYHRGPPPPRYDPYYPPRDYEPRGGYPPYDPRYAPPYDPRYAPPSHYRRSPPRDYRREYYREQRGRSRSPPDRRGRSPPPREYRGPRDYYRGEMSGPSSGHFGGSDTGPIPRSITPEQDPRDSGPIHGRT